MSYNDKEFEKPLVKTIFDNIKSARNAQNEWRNQARTAYAFYAGNQWDAQDKARLNDEERPHIVFNRTVRVVNAVIGLEIQNRQTIVYTPRESGDVITSDLLTGAANWVRDNCDAEDEESQAFKDCIISGIGWIETRLDYEKDPDGEIVIDRIDPLEMYYDPNSKKRNLDDAKWIAREKKFTRKEFKEFWPDTEIFQDSKNQILLDDFSPAQTIDREEARFYRNDDNNIKTDDLKKISVVQYQWYQREIFYRVQNGDVIEELTPEEFRKAKPIIELTGSPWIKQHRRRYKQAFIYGDEILEEGDNAIQAFTFKAITGLQDRNENSWFGLLALMHDPQMYANKWLSQILYILNTNPSGGYFYETGAFADIRRAQNDISHPAKNIQLNAGGLDKIQQKTPPTFPAGIDKLLNYAVESINDLVGVNLEMLGVANRTQAGVLEEQRKEAGITILADFFDALRRYRKDEGRVIADFILKYIADGRLIRISGAEMGRYVPLLKSQLNFKYDIIIDEVPTSINSRQRIFDFLIQMLPQFMQAGIPIPPEILDYAPLPAELVLKWKKMLNAPQSPDEMEELAKEVKKKLAQLEIAQREQDLQSGQIKMKKTQADIIKTAANAELDTARASHEQALAKKDTVEMHRENIETILEMLERGQRAEPSINPYNQFI